MVVGLLKKVSLYFEHFNLDESSLANAHPPMSMNTKAKGGSRPPFTACMNIVRFFPPNMPPAVAVAAFAANLPVGSVRQIGFPLTWA